MLIWSLAYRHWLARSQKQKTKKVCKISLKLTIKTPKMRHWRRSDVLLSTFYCQNFTFTSDIFLGDFEETQAR